MGNMADYDYAALGLKCGLECHQQLNTKKLFCKCPSVMREDEPDVLVRRAIRPMMSELGEYDPAALEAYRKGKTFIYQAYSDTNCLVETDEEPPRPFNPRALATGLEVSMLLHAKFVDRIQVMRKVIVDGSTTTSFQRTALVAGNGYIEVAGKRFGIDTIILEEDAARPIERGEKEVTYRLDRQGIPLIEVSTAPDIRHPDEAKALARAIGQTSRLTGKARRGLGTIRQDVNVSIREGTRYQASTGMIVVLILAVSLVTMAGWFIYFKVKVNPAFVFFKSKTEAVVAIAVIGLFFGANLALALQ